MDNAIHRINHYPLDIAIGFAITYPVDSEFEQLGPAVYYGEKDFSLGFFLQTIYPFKAMNLGAFLALGRQYWGMWLVYFVTSSQCFIRPRNKHKQMVGMGLTD